ncbi:LysR family transcriptional regulator [Microbulbifer sp. TRSA005]|uniref:LysR family transcriptional regulator n=1 Tax=Microbulbifer sp. TRSA005 TaxID=3243383 RepID=UPI0040390B73
MAVSIEQLEAFVATEQAGSFSAAARKCGKAQSVISSLVSNLEVDLGVNLFDRSQRYPRLTDAGESLLERARNLIEQRERLMAIAQGLSLDVEARLTLAIAQHVRIKNLGGLFQEFETKYPHVQITLRAGSVQDVQTWVEGDIAQLGIITQLEEVPAGCDFRALGQLKLTGIACVDHPIARLTEVTWEDLKQYRQILLQEFEISSQTRWLVSPDVWSVSRVDDALDLVEANLGWAVLPLHVVAKGIAAKKLIQLPLVFEQEKELSHGVDIIWSSKRPLGPAATDLMKWLSTEDAILNKDQSL